MNTRYQVLTLLSLAYLAACEAPSAPADLLPFRRLAATTMAGNVVVLQPQESYQLTAKLTGSRARSVQWSSDNAAVANVSRTGLVTAVSGGTATITATNGSSTEAWQVNVRIPAQITVQSSGTLPLAIGAQTALMATASDGVGSFAPRNVTWRVDSGTSVSVTSAGLVTAVNNGASVVSATSSGVSGRIRLQVGATVTATALNLTPANPVLAPNGQVQFNASVSWSDGSTTTPSVAYAASSGTITGTGLFTAGSQTGNVTVTATCSCGLTATTTVMVVQSSGSGPSIVMPTAPAVYKPAYPTRTGAVIRVEAGDDLQAALNRAQPGDEVVLANGATFTGNFLLPAKVAGDKWIVVRSETVPIPQGTRMTPSLGSNLATIMTPNALPAIGTQVGTNRWRIVGVSVRTRPGQSITYNLIALGSSDERLQQDLPRNIVLDRMLIMGQPNDALQRCVLFNADSLAVIDSWVAECHGKGFESHGVSGWNGGGPFLIENNRIEGAGINVFFGGADPLIRGLNPSDIVVRRNHLLKPLSWANGRWTVKNLFELKNGRRVLVEGNVLENNWADAQTGGAMLLQTVSDNNTSTDWVTVQDVRIENNIVRNATGGITVAARIAYGGPLPANPTARVLIKNNLFENVGIDPVSGNSGRLVALYQDLSDVSVLNNTFTSPRRAAQAVIGDGPSMARLTIAGNVFAETEYGLGYIGTRMGQESLDKMSPAAIFKDNVLPGQADYASWYPGGNWFPVAGSSVVFQSPSSGDYSLTAANPFFMGAYGRVGVSMSALLAATSGVTN